MHQVELLELDGCVPPRLSNDAPVMSAMDYPRVEAQGYPSRDTFAIYVSSLAIPLCTTLRRSGRNSVTTRALQETSLTNLFQNKYGVDITGLALRERDPFRLACKVLTSPLRSCVQLKYQAMGNPQSPFWRLTLDGSNCSVQMRCVSPQDPLTGFGDITRLPGAEEALRGDIAILRDAVASTRNK